MCDRSPQSPSASKNTFPSMVFMLLLIISCLSTSLFSLPPALAESANSAGSSQEPKKFELKFSELFLSEDFQTVEWLQAKAPRRQPRHYGYDAYRWSKNLGLNLVINEEPRPFHLLDGDIAVLDDGNRRLRFYLLAGAWSIWDRQAEKELQNATLSPEEAITAVRKALENVTELKDRDHAVVFANTLSEEREDGEPGETRTLSYNVFFQTRIDGVQLVGGGATSSGTVTGSTEEPKVLYLAHAVGDFDLENSKVLWQETGQLVSEVEARARLLKGQVLLADTPPDTVSSGTITRVARAYFADGRYLHREAIPVYVYQVVFEPLFGEPFSHDYFVSALSHDGWQTLGYDSEELATDSRFAPGIAGFDLTPAAKVWQDDEDFVFPSFDEKAASLAFASNHCAPQWNFQAGTWQAQPWCQIPCQSRDDFCAQMGMDPQRTFAISVRWAGLTASHIPDLPGSSPLPSAYRDAWIGRIRQGFENACYTPLTGYGSNGVISGIPGRPDRPDVAAAAEAGFYFHMSHGWDLEPIECPNVGKRFSKIIPMGFSVEPFLMLPFISSVTSCDIKPDWSGEQIRYFFNMSSFGNAGRRQWTQVVGGGPENPKVVIGNVSHGNRFHFSPYAPLPSTPPTTNSAQSYPNMLSNFFHNLTLLDTSNLQYCRPAGMSFRAAMREAVIGTATSQTDYGWPPEAHRNQPKAMRLVFSTKDQALDEHLPEWGDQYPNDNNYSGWEYIAWGSEWSP